MALFEQLFRHTRYFWALVQCVPFLTNYLPLFRTLRALRLVVDFACPVLQHFALVSDALHPRRALLSRATSLIVNAAINSALITLLFRSFTPVCGENQGANTKQYDNSANTNNCSSGNTTLANGRLFCLPTRVQNTYDSLTSFMLSYCHGYPRLLLSNGQMNEIQVLLEQLAPTNFMNSFDNNKNNCNNNSNNNNDKVKNYNHTDHDDRYFGKVILFLLDELTDGKDYADVLQHSKPRFAILLLKEIVHQGLHIDSLVFNNLITIS